MIPYCKEHGIGLIPWGPLQNGTLARPLGQTSSRQDSTQGTRMERGISEPDKEIIIRVEEIAKKRGWKMSEVALAWVDGKVSSPIVGISSVRSH